MNNIVPLVSIITPTYNRASYIEETIQSVLNQDYPNIEYIVLDDGSTDHTREVLAKYTGRLHWETHPNMGEQRTVNKGLSMARGEIMTVINSDDPLLPEAVSTIVNFMQTHPDVLAAYPNWQIIGPHAEILDTTDLPEYNYLDILRHYGCGPGPATFFRRKAFDFVELRNPEYRTVADWDFWLRLGLHGPFARIPQTLATFRVHPDSASVAQQGIAMAEERIQQLHAFFKLENLPPEVQNIRREALGWVYLRTSKMNGLPRETARKYYLAALHYHPSLLWKERGWNYALSYRLPRLPYLILFVGGRKLGQLFKTTLLPRLFNIAVSLNIPGARTLYWNHRARDIDEKWGDERDDYALLRDILQRLKPIRILDFGCGSGRLFPLYQELHIPEVVGQDISKNALTLAQAKHHNRNISLTDQHILELTYPSQYFDLIISNRVLQHIPKEAIESVIGQLATLGKQIYISEMGASDNTGETFYLYQHRYIELFADMNFHVIQQGTMGKKTWFLFAKEN